MGDCVELDQFTDSKHLWSSGSGLSFVNTRSLLLITSYALNSWDVCSVCSSVVHTARCMFACVLVCLCVCTPPSRFLDLSPA